MATQRAAVLSGMLLFWCSQAAGETIAELAAQVREAENAFAKTMADRDLRAIERHSTKKVVARDFRRVACPSAVCASARRHNKGLPAKAIMASEVKVTMRATPGQRLLANWLLATGYWPEKKTALTRWIPLS